MPLEDLPLPVQLLIGLIVPPILTILCWLIGHRLAGSRHAGYKMWNQPGFWALLIAAYVFFTLAIAGSRFLNLLDRADPSSQLVQ
jgi:hypothetical protein